MRFGSSPRTWRRPKGEVMLGNHLDVLELDEVSAGLSGDAEARHLQSCEACRGLLQEAEVYHRSLNEETAERVLQKIRATPLQKTSWLPRAVRWVLGSLLPLAAV